MKKINGIIWGIVLVALGLIFGLKALGVADIDIFFKGWWTLFIIIPSIIGLFTERDKTGNAIGLLIGVGLLLAARGVFSFGTFWKLLIPALIIVVGIKLIIGNVFNKKKHSNIEFEIKKESQKEYASIFSGNDFCFVGEVFEGAEFTAVFGGINAHLENAVIEHDVTVKANAIFGGIDIYLPANVNVKLLSTSVFGGSEDKRRRNYIENAPTVYVEASAIFGGVDLK